MSTIIQALCLLSVLSTHLTSGNDVSTRAGKNDDAAQCCLRCISSPASCPSQFPHKWGSSCYSVSADKRSFAQAKAVCEVNGGKLAEVENAAENSFLKTLAHPDGSTDGYWIGGSDQAQEGRFVWVSDNRPFTFTDWSTFRAVNGRASQPDNAGNEDCVEIRVEAGFNLQWNDHQCGIAKKYICELSRN